MASSNPTSPPRRDFSPTDARPGDIIYVKSASEISSSSRRTLLADEGFPSTALDHPGLVLQKSQFKKNCLLICTVASFEERTLALVEAQNAFEVPYNTPQPPLSAQSLASEPSPPALTSEASTTNTLSSSHSQQIPAYIPIYPCRPLVRGTPQLTLESPLLPYPGYLNTTTIHTIPYTLLRSFNSTTPISAYRLSAKSLALLLGLLQSPLDALEASLPPTPPTPTALLSPRSHSLPPRPALYGSSRPHRISPRPSFMLPGRSQSCTHNTALGKQPTVRTALLGEHQSEPRGYQGGAMMDAMAEDRRRALAEHWITIGVCFVFGALGLWMILVRR